MLKKGPNLRKQRLYTKKLYYAKQDNYNGVSDSARCAKPLRKKKQDTHMSRLQKMELDTKRQQERKHTKITYSVLFLLTSVQLLMIDAYMICSMCLR